MTTSASTIASWEEDCDSSESRFNGHDSIATEAQPLASPVWQDCIDSLLKLWVGAAMPPPAWESPPNRRAIEAAIAWIAFLCKQYPNSPPTCITPEPAGGIIVERRVPTPNGDSLCELTFYNDGIAERTDYFNGRILQMNSIPPSP